jgi:hypothetical protein
MSYCRGGPRLGKFGTKEDQCCFCFCCRKGVSVCEQGGVIGQLSRSGGTSTVVGIGAIIIALYRNQSAKPHWALGG